ncbi:transcriptional regulator, LuxR family protein [Treponema primitia ZAS-2]|uniref:Transcriptional regulator, LuxR family protein n=1 Tax=Treponema primitia (strain ATCC BAA-887 / DSM 12427 / ZAS-2) TaxID=545694 RepID=F5YJK9_TREPZ|nr:LuxR C-terminal-related transcriptional regulator [Treponema primitia]AEF83674.1 transcriptional regulator, LuxR family protein [Treponema primitia ZAS-2]
MPDQLFYSNVPINSGNQIYLDRPQVHDLLEKAARSPIVTVTAGAGYGKTQAVYSFARKYNAVTAWIQFSERDNLGGRFWENYTRAVGFIDKETELKLRALEFPDTDQKFERYMRIPRNDIKPAQKYLFVYDDFHLIRDPGVLHFIERSITTPFSNITSILISRTEPRINSIPLLSKGYLAQINEDDLRFTAEETQEYFYLQQVDAPPDAAATVCRDTEGWAFAIHLAALAIKNEPSGKRYAPSSVKANIFKLIESEVVAVISEDLRKFLIKISLIEHLARDILLDIAGDAGILEELEGLGSFVRYDPYLNAWRVHHLFLEYLSGRQGELSEEEKQDVYSKAARWCVENNLKMDAFSYYEKAGSYDAFLEASYTLPPILPSPMAAFLLEILDRAPDSLFQENPLAYLLQTRILFTLKQFDRASAGLREIITQLEIEAPSFFNNRVLTGCYNNLGLIGLITSMHTCDYSYVSFFERAYHYSQLSGHKLTGPATVAPLSSYLCRVSSPEKGEAERYNEAIAAMAPYMSDANGGLGYGMGDMAWAELAFFRVDMANAEQMAYQALFKAQKKNQYEIASRAFFYLIRINLFYGNPEKIEELLKLMEAQLEEKGYLNRYTDYDVQTGWFYAHIGQISRMASWLKNDFEESDLNPMLLGQETLVRVKYYITQKQHLKALRLIENDKDEYGMGAFLFGKIGNKLIEAMCFYDMKDIPWAINSLEEAYYLAAPNGLDMIFIEQGKRTRALFSAVLKHQCSIPREWLEKILRSASAYAKKLYITVEKFQDPDYEDAAGPVILSRRELLVLRGLSRGLTREELADDGDISLNTVKSVIRSVYNKLGAVNRADAVRIATSLGILKSDDLRN